MKNIVQVVFGFLSLIFCTGCSETGRRFWNVVEPGCTHPGVYMGGALHEPVPRNALPPNPVRGSETIIVNPLIGVRIHHSQGTQNYVQKNFDPCTGQTSVHAEQSTWTHTSVSKTPVQLNHYGTEFVPHKYPITSTHNSGNVWRHAPPMRWRSVR